MKGYFLFIFLLISCSDKVYRYDFGNQVIATSQKEAGSNSATTLMATAIKEVHKLDIVIFPSELLRHGRFAMLNLNMSKSEIDKITSMFDLSGPRDSFKIGRMRGADIKRFILKRNQRADKADLHTVGLDYKLELRGGTVESYGISMDFGRELDLERVYKVAISDYYYLNNATFPGYYYGNGLNRGFTSVRKTVSAKKSLRTFLENMKRLPELSYRHSSVIKRVGTNLGFLGIPTIQGSTHRSDFIGHVVTTSGIVTALGDNNRFPKGFEFYIQDRLGDSDLRTSDAIRVFILNNSAVLKLGDEVTVSAIVYEEMTNTGLSRTSLMNVSEVSIISRGNSLPAASSLGVNGRAIPNKRVSTWAGDLNFRPSLVLTDGVDFWESLEGMRVILSDPRVVGFRGGHEEYESTRAKEHLNLYVVGDGRAEVSNSTWKNGIMISLLENDFNPEIIQIITNHLSKGIPNNNYFNVGDIIGGELTGVLTYEMNLFGDGEFSIVLPEVQDILTLSHEGKGEVRLENRPKSKLFATDDQLTIATFNIENLSSDQVVRIKQVGLAIKESLKCPDILNLVEVQDNNGEDFAGGPSADLTMKEIIKSIDCGPRYNYKALNIDPFNHHEGGVPGGNIQVAMIYNANRLGFNSRPVPGPFADTRILEDGSLSYNPGRVFPEDSVFKGTRKSIVAQFEFRGEKVFVIGNHFNSKLGDSSTWSSVQPVVFGSEVKRSKLAERVNAFVAHLDFKNPSANIVVLGDFNAYVDETSMKILEGNLLKNLMNYNNIWPKEKRYTTNFNGNSQALDYIFVNQNLLNKKPEFEVLHINSDYMGRLSDHDPLTSRFTFD